MDLDRSDNPILCDLLLRRSWFVDPRWAQRLHIIKSQKESEFSQPTKGAEGQSAGGSGPLQVAHRVHVGHVFTTGCLP